MLVLETFIKGVIKWSPLQFKVTKVDTWMSYQSRGQPVLKQNKVFGVLVVTSP